MSIAGGKVMLFGLGMYTPAASPLTNFATVASSASVETFGFHDLSGNIRGVRFGKQ